MVPFNHLQPRGEDMSELSSVRSADTASFRARWDLPQRRNSESSVSTDHSARAVLKQLFNDRATNGELSLDSFAEILTSLRITHTINYDEYRYILLSRGCNIETDEEESLVTPKKLHFPKDTSPANSELTSISADALCVPGIAAEPLRTPSVAEVEDILAGIRRSLQGLQRDFAPEVPSARIYERISGLERKKCEIKIQDAYAKLDGFHSRIDESGQEGEFVFSLKEEVIAFNREVRLLKNKILFPNL